MAAEKDREEMAMLREQISDLQKKLLEKDEALKSAENTVNQMSASYGILEEQVAEKDSQLKSTTSQLQNAKVTTYLVLKKITPFCLIVRFMYYSLHGCP